jgi:3-oxoacyl-[acyl-carrier protein] reductase
MQDRQVVLITGTRKGIGRYLAEHFIKRGCLVEGCSRDLPDWELDGYTHHRADVADEAAVRTMLSAIQKRHGRLDIVINNAGVAAMNHTLLTTAAALDRIMNTNLRGTFLICRESAKIMQRRKYGRIINLSTIAVPMRLEGEALYAASKSAVETLTRIMARELGPLGITVNAIGPTPIETDLIRGVPAEKIQQIIDQLAIKRLGRLEDVANVVDFFARPESDYITGQVIYLGGVS